MKKRQIVNIVNFIRALEPRFEVDMVDVVRQQIKLMKKHNLRGTFLIQYDALLLPEYTDMLTTLDREQFEIGVWHEIVQPEVEACGIEWKGRYSWDWHTHCGFPVGYNKKQRELIADELFRKFKEVFGFYPRVLGSWLYDTHTIRYLNERYGLDAICNCKEQFGTDGYTLWGGYYGQGYYPCAKNVFMPAKDADSQINVPLFRMLGSDHVYQYDYRMDPELDAQVAQAVITLEACCGVPPQIEKTYVDLSSFTLGGGGGNSDWVDWYIKENFNGECLSFGYTQAGQENPFGWQWMKTGFLYQIPLFEKLQKEGKICVEPIGDTGRWYKDTFEVTPSSAITAHCAYDDDNKTSVWYSSRFYRVNIYTDNGQLRIRDIHIFSDDHPDKYEDEVCTENFAVYESLPFIDGCRYTGKGVVAGGYLKYTDGSAIKADSMIFDDKGDGIAEVKYADVFFELGEDYLVINAPSDFELENRIGVDGGHLPKCYSLNSKKLELNYEGTDYSISLGDGIFENANLIKSENNTIKLMFQ